MAIKIPNNWIPRPDQMKLWTYLEDGGLRAVAVCHRRWGKDAVALHYTATAAMQRVGNYWHMLPQYTQCRKAIWDAVDPLTGNRRVDDAFPKDIRSKTRDTDMFIEFKNGATWQVVGSDNYNNLVGSSTVGIVFSEYALADPQSWAYLSPILEANKGWAIFISTSRGNNHLKMLSDFARVEPGWFSEILKADQTPVFTQDRLESIRREMAAQFGPELGEALYQQEYFCSFEGAVIGSYFARQILEARQQGRITKVPHQPALEVDTFWDLGVDDSMSIWFVQHTGRAHNCIDYYESSGYGLEHYAKLLKSKPYTYGNHYMPHDAQAREMTNSEIAKSRKEVAEGLGIKPIQVVSRAHSMDVIIQVQIPAARNMIPLCWFDEVKCAGGISALESYRAEYDEERKKLSNRPLHDWSSHGSSAFITFAVGYVEKKATKPITPGRAIGWR